MLLLGLIMSITVPPNPLETPFEQITPEVAAERISKCGLREVTIRYEEYLQSEVLTAAGATSVTDEQLACADKAASYYDLELPPAVQPRYEAIREARLSAYSLKQSEAWLAERGLLERIPRYEAKVTDDEAFVRQLEDLCGARAKGALMSMSGFYAINPDWAARNLVPPFLEGGEVLICLGHLARVAGFNLGFIGNEAAPHEN